MLTAPPRNRKRKSIDDLKPSVGRETGAPGTLPAVPSTESPTVPRRSIDDRAASFVAAAHPPCAPNESVGPTLGSTNRPSRNGARQNGSGYITSPRITAAWLPANSL